MCTIAILFGGQSSEHPVSLMSATSVCQHLSDKYQKYLVGITTDGRWYHYKGKITDIENGNWENYADNEEVIFSPSADHHGFYNLRTHKIDRVDVVFPVLHGQFGEDGTIQGLCYLNRIPCVSCSMSSCVLAMDKELTHILCENAGIKMAKYLAYHRENHPSYAEMFAQVQQKLQLPCYVKPAREGSSFGAHKINNYDDFCRYTDDAFGYDSKILFEEFIDGTEVGCGVLSKNITAEVFEVIVDTEMYGYEEKYDGYKTRIVIPAENLSSEQREEVNKLGLKIADILGCDVMARIDFFNSSKGLVFNEANLIPGFTSHSLYPAMYEKAGIEYGQLLDKLINLVFRGSDEK
ncbi:MAG: D-alanine--D-alanine ligase family protein [Erysipelotrichia bacterium]|nr:D-alanine--D-alanine ligase family protein [Erysipelotrichia bacterium]